jgi:hypothetical protein
MKNDELNNFLAEGMKRYKKASEIMIEFYENVKLKLQQILENRKEWEIFKPGEVKKIKSTKFWDKYPFANAQIAGKINGRPATIKIGINWYASESDYPFYGIWFYDTKADEYIEKLKSYKKHGKVELSNDKNSLVLYPNPDDFDLERDFNLLLDEFLGAISK